MKLKKVSKATEEEFSYNRIQHILLVRGYIASLNQCYELWNEFSDSMGASWMRLAMEDDMVFRNISPYIED